MTDLQTPFIMLTIILVLATYTDIVAHRIPNILSLGGALIGISMHSSFNGFDGFLFSLGGLAVGLVLFLPFYMLRGMGAGDVKLMAAVGSFVGPQLALAAVAGTLIAGTILALVYVVLKGGTALTMRRYALMARLMSTTHHFMYLRPTDADAGGIRFPYASAILVGTFAGVWWVERSFPLIGG